MRPLFKYLRIIIASVVYQSENKAVLIFFDRLLIANVIKECFDAVLFQGWQVEWNSNQESKTLQKNASHREQPLILQTVWNCVEDSSSLGFFAICVAVNGCGGNAIVVVISVIVVFISVIVVVVVVVKTYRKYCSAELITVVFTGRDRLETTFGKNILFKFLLLFKNRLHVFNK